MLLSRIFGSIAFKYQNRFVLKKSQSFLSHLSVGLSSKDDINQPNGTPIRSNSPLAKNPADDNNNNEWLWEYLRERKTFSDLTEEQRRRVIEIGQKEFIDLHTILNCVCSLFRDSNIT